MLGHAPKPAKQQGDVRAEDAAIAVALVDDHAAEPPEERRPPPVLRKDPAVQHVRVGEHPVACARTQSRSTIGVSPSNDAARTPGTSKEDTDRSWSAPSALVGERYSAVAFSPAASRDSTGSW